MPWAFGGSAQTPALPRAGWGTLDKSLTLAVQSFVKWGPGITLSGEVNEVT